MQLLLLSLYYFLSSYGGHASLFHSIDFPLINHRKRDLLPVNNALMFLLILIILTDIISAPELP